MDQPDKVAINPARGQLNRKNEYPPVPMNDWTVDTGVVDALVAEQHGQWYDFNDRKVQYSTVK